MLKQKMVVIEILKSGINSGVPIYQPSKTFGGIRDFKSIRFI